MKNWIFSVAFYCKFAGFSSFLIKNNFFSENPPVLSKKNLFFESFEKSHSLSLILQQFWCFYLFFLKKSFCLQKTHFSKNTKFSNVLKISTYSVAFFCKLANCRDFGKNIFFLITHLICFQQKPKFWTLREILVIQLHSTANLLPSAIFQKNHIFFPKNTYILFNKSKFWTFWELLLFQSHFAANLLSYAFFRKNHGFFSKYPSFFSTEAIFWFFERFGKSYFFSRILRQICYF